MNRPPVPFKAEHVSWHWSDSCGCWMAVWLMQPEAEVTFRVGTDRGEGNEIELSESETV